MNLLETYDSLLQDWRKVFSQKRTFERARRLTFGLLVCLRLHLTSRAICAVGRQFVDWSADYRLCSRSPWNPLQLFDPIFDRLPGAKPPFRRMRARLLCTRLCWLRPLHR